MCKQSRRSFPFIFCASLFTLLICSCVTTSLHSPRPNRPGKVSLGGHASYVLFAESTESDDEVNFPVLINGTFRTGLFERGELGINAGQLGGDLALKYGFLDYDDPLQLSAIGGFGLLYWQTPSVNLGLLLGYKLGDVIQLYGGYRHHLAFVFESYTANIGDAIVGLELLPAQTLSIMVEYDHIIYYMGSSGFEDVGFDPGSFGLGVINGGININF
jgi:hypothetical protein